ncbi:hypothetical protein LTS18_005995 [Coniosporium uncinatum]|uniref:Uncharacterized protein n=1 Tax=Coniosporium uncinatum TaxID=93489 RepID=A0ACC3DCF1_9PEZI|nr:hypothetical protein LTS18_005995 [Coniosporium uncinatum]
MGRFDKKLSISQVLDITSDVCSKSLEDEIWFQNYLKTHVESAFELDDTMFAQEEFLSYMSKAPAFSKALVKIIVDIYADKSTNKAKKDSRRCETGEGIFGDSVPEKVVFACPPSPMEEPKDHPAEELEEYTQAVVSEDCFSEEGPEGSPPPPRPPPSTPPPPVEALTPKESITGEPNHWITRAYLEMDLHLDRVSKAISNFLEDDLSATYLGLSSGARAHLVRFRSFLHSQYVERFGYWPPPKGSPFSKTLYRTLYFDFRSLYDFLVDLDSTDALETQRPATGDICVCQNVGAFDKRHKCEPLPHPLPLEPTCPPDHGKTQSQCALIALKLGSKPNKIDRYMATRAALSAATNTQDAQLTNSPLVKAYKQSEYEICSSRQEEKVSLVDARKVRWILIYGALQMLISVIRAPKEVRDTEGPNYPLCCLVAGTPPWKPENKGLPTSWSATPSALSLHSNTSSRPGTSNSTTPVPVAVPTSR